MATNPLSLPLHEKIPRKNTVPRAVELVLLFLLLSLLVYRLFSLHHHGFPWLLALLCESWFAFNWVLIVCIKWTQFDYKTYPQRLLQRITELPRVDMFVTTADPILEPPILTMNTVLSLLAVDYPANKLACYLSDDGCSPLTFYSLVETSKFAKIWVPFCKKYEVSVRAPFRYFTPKSTPSKNSSDEFQQEWKRTKDEYAQLCQKIENASQKSVPCDLNGEFAAFADVERRNHPTIIKVIWDNKEVDVPSVVYISREKCPKHPHHFKAGAMNALTRVSGVMTNAAFMLNVDCDMFVNNPKTILHAMCLLLGVKNDKESGYVQSPQHFYDGIKDDPFGNQLVVLYEFMGRGIAGAQGPFYGGTGCFHRRKVIYGLSPDEELSEGWLDIWINNRRRSNRADYPRAGMEIRISNSGPTDISRVCTFGWASLNDPDEEMVHWAFGDPVQFKKPIHLYSQWEAPISSMPGLLMDSCVGPTLRSRDFLCYATRVLYHHQLLFLAQGNGLSAALFLKMWFNEQAIFLPIAIFAIYNLYTLYEYLRIGQPVRAWWNNQRMWRINAMTSYLFGLLSVILKLLGLSQTVFEVTQKDQTNNEDETDANAGRYTFDSSLIFVPGTTILLVNLTALAIVLLGFCRVARSGDGVGVGEILCSVGVVLCFWAFFKGLFGKGKYGIPSPTIFKAGALALLFLHLCKWGSKDKIVKI
ncbi:hypothetical protein LguiB_002558 [Lonicera macranthoides]